jgi:steroid delta-isomerase-like uncharacterized protein
MAGSFPTLAQDLVDAWNSHDPDRVLALFTDDPVTEDVTFDSVSRGRDEVRQAAAGAFATFPDIHFELITAVLAAEGGAAEWTMTGTHTADLPGMPATQKAFTVRGVSVFTLVDGRIRRNRDYWDLATMMRQLGFLPEAAAASS